MLTILTPSFNRCDLLKRLYRSLEKQSSKNFKWIIIDDGSSDDTEEYISNLKTKSSFEISYYKKINGGKHTALNQGFSLIKTEWFAIVDSDDWLKPDCVETLLSEIERLRNNESCIVTHRSFPDGTINGDVFVEGSYSYLERKYNNIKGDKFEVYNTKVVENFRFPVYEGEKFMAESPLHMYVGNNYNSKFLNYSGYVGDYLEGGLTYDSVKNRYANVNSTLFVYSNQYSSLKFSKAKVRAGINWWRFYFSLKGGSTNDHISYILSPFGFLLYFRDLLNDKKKQSS
ncbi:glycosyltransferase family 2 protein [Escherichia coli]|nr:glycosyltransferase family 2 protein [Escherichia coli]